MGRLRTQYLSQAGTHAVIERDGVGVGGHILSIGGAEQSHVNLQHPEDIFYEYLHRVANVVDLLQIERDQRPLRALHLGAGALTLARYIDHYWPDSQQVAVEQEPELIPFVTRELPLREGLPLEVHTADAREALERFTAPFDLIVLDIFTGEDSPPHLYTASFFDLLRSRLRGTHAAAIVNIGDDPPLRFTNTVLANAAHAFAPRDMFLTGPAAMFTRRQAGNLVLALTAGTPEQALRRAEHWPARLDALGPAPATTLTGSALAEFGSL